MCKWKYYLYWVKNLFYLNPVKSLFILGAVLSFYWAGSFEDDVKYYKLVSKHVKKEGGVTNYIYLIESSNRSSGYDVIVSNESLNVIDGHLEDYVYHVANVLLWIAFGGFLFILILCTIFSDDDVGWDLDDVSNKTLLGFVRCELESGNFYYIAFGRLLGSFDKQLKWDILNKLGIGNLSDIKRCPRFKTKSEDRRNKLKELGIS